MPSPRRTKSPARRKVSKSRSRSRSAGRVRKTTASKVKEVTVKKTSASPSRIPTRRSTSKSPARSKVKASEAAGASSSTVTETVVTRRVYSSSAASGDGQVKASVTPVRSSARIASIIERERESAASLRQQLKSEVMANMTTPTKDGDSEGKKVNKKFAYEFMGPIGTFLMIFLLPLTVYYINLACRKGNCSILVLPKMPKDVVKAFFDVEVTLIFLAWLCFQALLAVLPVGRLVDGQPLRAGGRLKYRCNGFLALVVSLAALGAGIYFKLPVTIVVDKFFKFMTAAVLFSFALSKTLFVSSFFVDKKKLAHPSGNWVYDFFMGRELNPRVGPLDLKFFFELRPGLIGWVLLDWVMVYKAYLDSGAAPPTLTLVTVFQTLYVADALWHEESILTTMDIIHDGFGFMLCFGDIAWVPFLYSLQPRFLLETGYSLPWWILAPITALNLVGYAVFRLSNSQKDKFRKDPKHPSVADLETLGTSSGRRLLVGGWWGVCRKPNYLGDLIMATAWSLTTGLGHVIPYFYPLYFLVLLVHRERRDHQLCQAKHGRVWGDYCARVKYRIFPYIY